MFFFILLTHEQEINGRKKRKDITHVYRVKKTKSGNPINVGFPISPLVTSLEGESPLRGNGIPVLLNSIYVTLNSSEKKEFYIYILGAFKHIHCIIEPP